MKGKRLVLLLSVMLTAFLAGGLTLYAHADGTAASAVQAEQSKHIEKTLTHTVRDAGCAFNLSLPKLRAINAVGIGGFSGTYGAQLKSESLERKIYDAMVTYYVRSQKSGSVDVALSFSFSGTGDYEKSDEYLEAQEEIEYAVESAFGAFLYDYPEVFWAGDLSYAENFFADVTFGEKETFSGSFTGVTISLMEVYSGASKAQNVFTAAIRDAKSEIEKARVDATQYQTLKAIHDYVCAKITYPYDYNLETTVPVYHSPAGVFLQGGVAVCEGYAKSFMILCREFDIPAILVVGDAGGSHMWNYVQLQGSWYAVDTTWDDTGGPAPATTYFMIGSETSVPGGTFGSTRVLNTCFSASGKGKNFNYPILNGTAYRKENSHVHSWCIASETKPTCTKSGEIKYKCSICGEVTSNIVAALGHSYHDKNYVYNNDATVFSDGTMSLVCDNGCGEKKTTVPAPGTKIPATIKLNVTSLVLKRGQSTTALKVSGLAQGDSILKWESLNPKIVKVSQSGKITAKQKIGTAKIRITLKSGLKRKVKVTVQANDVLTSKISGVTKSITLKKGKTKKLAPVITPITSVQKLIYKSSNTKVATVSTAGMIKAKKKGKTTITMKSGRKTIKCVVTVK